MSVEISELYRKIKHELNKVIIGQDEAINQILAVFFSGGHALLEGMPGTAKTLIVRCIASALQMSYGRVQMTPDLLPGDITGSSIYREDLHEFEFHPGPVFNNFLLADEINRASAKTQSALLESMQELTVTYGGKTYILPEPFMVFATQNPVEQEGTYPLPIAQLDRFMFKIIIDYPDSEAEKMIYRQHHASNFLQDMSKSDIEEVLTAQDIINAREVIKETHVRDEVIAYVQNLMHATRNDDSLLAGASPRAGLMLLMGAKSLARFAGRDFVVPDDIKEAFIASMRHRVIPSPSAELEGYSSEDILLRILQSVDVPR